MRQRSVNVAPAVSSSSRRTVRVCVGVSVRGSNQEPRALLANAPPTVLQRPVRVIKGFERLERSVLYVDRNINNFVRVQKSTVFRVQFIGYERSVKK